MNKKLLINRVLIFGGLTGLACFLFFLGLYSIEPNPLNLRRPDIGINIIMIWAAIWYYKRFNGGILHFYEGFTIGFLTNLIGAIISGLLIFLFIEIVDYKPFETWLIEGKNFLIREKKMIKEILNEENFERQLASFDTAKSYQLIFDELMFKQLSIIPISLMSLVMRKINK